MNKRDKKPTYKNDFRKGLEEVGIIHCATIAHNVNQAYCKAIGEETQGNWDEAPE